MKLASLKPHIQSVLTALRRYRLAILANPRMMALVVLALVSLAAVPVLYLSDSRLQRGPWQTYEDGLFSIQERRDDAHFERFDISSEFRQKLEGRCGGRLVSAFQKTLFNEDGDVRCILHINVFSLDRQLSGRRALTPRDRAYVRYLQSDLPALHGYQVQRLPDQNGHPAVSYKNSTRDSEGFYSMGIVVCAHERAYFYEVYSHFSPYSDWWNDQRTYFCPPDYGQGFTPDDMTHIQVRFLLLSLAMLALFLGVLVVIYHIFTRQVRREHLPIASQVTLQHFNLTLTAGIILTVSMLGMMGSLWLFGGANALGLAGYVVTGLLQLTVVLPVLIHLYRKSRLA